MRAKRVFASLVPGFTQGSDPMSQIEDDTPTNNILVVTTVAEKPDDSMESPPEQEVLAPTGVTDSYMHHEDEQDRALRALQVAAVAGFVGKVGNTQASCISLCNTCREDVPLEYLRVCTGMPPSLLAIVCPGVEPAETELPSRVIPHRRVLKIYWLFDDAPSDGRLAEETEDKTTVDEGKGEIVNAREISHTSEANVDISTIRWPEGVKHIALCSFNRLIDALTLPDSVECLCLGASTMESSTTFRIRDVFNMPLGALAIPVGLREIFLGDTFDQPIEDVGWPVGLERLSLPGFNHSIRNVQWPARLKSLEFMSPSVIKLWKRRLERAVCAFGGGKFNQLLGTTLPPSLESLWLSSDFNQPLNDVAWPGGIVTLGLAFDFKQYYHSEGVTWPSNLPDLYMVNTPDESEGLSYPRDSRITVVETTYAGSFGGLYQRGNLIRYYERGQAPIARPYLDDTDLFEPYPHEDDYDRYSDGDMYGDMYPPPAGYNSWLY